LCDALRRHTDDDAVWVYYKLTPLVPLLRTPALQQAGCRIELPASRMRTNVAAQQIWITVVRLLTEAWRPEGPRPNGAEAAAVLRQLAQNNFALIQNNPPLLYHNDLSATVSRYYWSEDAGYALWLCLADAAPRGTFLAPN
jgi:hypothetical protein